MKKIKLLVIVPYDGMIQIIRSFADTNPDYSIDILHEDEFQSISKICLEEKLSGYEAVLAQGETYEYIKNISTISCFEIPITYFDILASSRLSTNYDGKSIFLASQSITKMAYSLYGLLDFHIDICNVSLEESIKDTIIDLKNSGYTLFIVAANIGKVCRECGVNTIIITSSYESVTDSLNTAIQFLTQAEKNRLGSFVLEEYIEHIGISYLIFDEEEDLIQANNVVDMDRLIRSAQRLIPTVKQEKEIHRINIIKTQPFLMKGSLIKFKDREYIVFEIKKSLENSTTSIPGIIIKNAGNLSKDFYNVFYDDLRNHDFYNKTVSYSSSSNPVIIIGESGTGKSRLADFIYDNCIYRSNLFYIVDCKQLDKRGLNYMFNSINSPLYEYGITLYFKEINLLKKKYIDQLVDFLKQSLFIKSNKLIFSVTCSLNESYDNKLCELLTSKLGSFPLFLKPLRDRVNSIPSLSVLYINKLNKDFNKNIVGFEPEAMDYLQSFNWNDNIKQFKRVLKELFTLTNSNYISKQYVISILKEEIRQDSTPTNMKKVVNMTLEQITLNAVKDALLANNMNQTKTAKDLGISRTSLWRLLNKMS